MSRCLNVARSLGAAVLLSQCVVANAAFITETELFTLSTSAFGFTATKEVGEALQVTNDGLKTTFSNLTFDKFDTGLGTLLGVEVTLTSTFGSAVTIDVSYAEPNPDQTFRSELTFTSDGSQAMKLTGSGLNETSTQTPSTSCSVPELDPQTCSDSANAGPTNFNGTVGSPPLVLADFLGIGTFILTATLDSAIAPAITRVGDLPIDNLADNSTITGTLATNWQGSVSVRYEYRDPATGVVPEPRTLYLLLAGAAGIALLRRRLALVPAKRRR